MIVLKYSKQGRHRFNIWQHWHFMALRMDHPHAGAFRYSGSNRKQAHTTGTLRSIQSISRACSMRPLKLEQKLLIWFQFHPSISKTAHPLLNIVSAVSSFSLQWAFTFGRMNYVTSKRAYWMWISDERGIHFLCQRRKKTAHSMFHN